VSFWRASFVTPIVVVVSELPQDSTLGPFPIPLFRSFLFSFLSLRHGHVDLILATPIIQRDKRPDGSGFFLLLSNVWRVLVAFPTLNVLFLHPEEPATIATRMLLHQCDPPPQFNFFGR
jgi:hypothetical protein